MPVGWFLVRESRGFYQSGWLWVCAIKDPNEKSRKFAWSGGGRWGYEGPVGAETDGPCKLTAEQLEAHEQWKREDAPEARPAGLSCTSDYDSYTRAELLEFCREDPCTARRIFLPVKVPNVYGIAELHYLSFDVFHVLKLTPIQFKQTQISEYFEV